MTIARRNASKAGFTLVEVLVALAIVGVALTALLQMQLVSISMTDRSARVTRAALLLQALTDETLAGPLPDVGVREGSFDDEAGRGMAWRVAVDEARVPALDQEGIDTLREVRVTVFWDPSERGRFVEEVVYAAP